MAAATDMRSASTMLAGIVVRRMNTPVAPNIRAPPPTMRYPFAWVRRLMRSRWRAPAGRRSRRRLQRSGAFLFVLAEEDDEEAGSHD